MPSAGPGGDRDKRLVCPLGKGVTWTRLWGQWFGRQTTFPFHIPLLGRRISSTHRSVCTQVQSHGCRSSHPGWMHAGGAKNLTTRGTRGPACSCAGSRHTAASRQNTLSPKPITKEQRPAQIGEGVIHRETGLDSLSVGGMNGKLKKTSGKNIPE